MKKVVFLLLFLSVVLSRGVLAQDKKVEVFVTDWCPYCVKLETILKTNHIQYTRYDIERSAEGSRLFYRLGGEGVPMTRVDQAVIYGYDPEKIMTAIQG